jgi:ABC-type bacteriocin/lantibiotic exporter with double-glycine peptidase domain
LLVYVVIATLVVFAVNSTLDVVLTFAWIRTGQKMVYDLAGDLFSHIQRLSLR